MTTTHPTIIVGVDGSDASVEALRWAGRLATGTGARIEAIATWDIPTAYGWGAPPLTAEWDPKADMEKALTSAVDAAFGATRPVDMEMLVAQGHPAKVLLDRSHDALMLVVGSRGHGGFAGLLLGSVSTAVAEHATCPVLVVHGDRIPAEVSR
jgi:nucleotide-binding universal stress UspA family protein